MDGPCWRAGVFHPRLYGAPNSRMILNLAYDSSCTSLYYDEQGQRFASASRYTFLRITGDLRTVERYGEIRFLGGHHSGAVVKLPVIDDVVSVDSVGHREDYDRGVGEGRIRGACGQWQGRTSGLSLGIAPLRHEPWFRIYRGMAVSCLFEDHLEYKISDL